jgi:hypothetical protein
VPKIAASAHTNVTAKLPPNRSARDLSLLATQHLGMAGRSPPGVQALSKARCRSET